MGFIPMNLVETTIWWLKKAIALQETPPVCGNKHDFNRRVSFKFNQPMEKTEKHGKHFVNPHFWWPNPICLPFLTVKSCFRWNPIFPREIHMFQVKFEFLRKISLFPHLARSESRSAEVFAHWKGRHRGRGIIRCPAGCSGGVDGVVVRSSEFSKVIFMR